MIDHSNQLALWCASFCPAKANFTGHLNLQPVSGDAGFRSYFRLNSQPSLIAVCAPPDVEDIPGFVEKALFFIKSGINVPEIYAVDYLKGFLLIEDLGDRLLLGELTDQTVNNLYDLAEETLLRIQSLPVDTLVFQPYSEEKLLQEMGILPEWFITKLLGVNLDQHEKELLLKVFTLLVTSAQNQPQVIVHRDFHSRNLLLQPSGQIGVIDFQDGVIGPISYDLVSLLRDCYIRWPTEYVDQRVNNYYQKCLDHGLFSNIEPDQFKQWFDYMGLQRHFKVLGIFARLWLRDGKQQYLHDLPLVLRYTLEQLGSYDELKPCYQWFIDRLLPIIENQPWYKSWQTAGDKP